MATTVQLRNTNPQGAVDLPLLRATLAAGEVFDCPADLAGHAPHWRPATDEDVLDQFETREVDDQVEVLDPGAGLLAQVGNYELVEASPLQDLNIAQLTELAAESGIDLGGATKKADIIAAIEKGN